jgi:hypothetical protein
MAMMMMAPKSSFHLSKTALHAAAAAATIIDLIGISTLFSVLVLVLVGVGWVHSTILTFPKQ